MPKTGLLSLVADLAPVHVLADVAALRVEHIEAFVDGHILTAGLLSVNTDLENIVKSLPSIFPQTHLSGHQPALLPVGLPGDLLAGGDWLLDADLLHLHPAFLHRLLHALCPRLLQLHRGADLPLDIETLLVRGHGADWPGLGDTLALRGQHLDILTPGHTNVGAPVLLELPGHGDDDVPGHVLAPLLSGVPADLLLHWSLNQSGHLSTP